MLKKVAVIILIHPLIITKSLNTEKPILKKLYRFDETFNTFDDLENKRNKLNEYKPRTSNKINTKNVMIEHLKIIENRFIDIFTTCSIA